MIPVISIHTLLCQKQFIRYNDNSDLQHLYCFNHIWCSIRYMLKCKCIVYIYSGNSLQRPKTVFIDFIKSCD